MTGNLDSIRVMIVDECATFRRTLRKLLEPETDLAIVGETSDADSVPALAKQLSPDVVLIDVALFYWLKSRLVGQPTLRALVTVPTLERADIIKVFLGGARAVVPKPSPSHVWGEGIRTVGAGHYWLVNESIAALVKALHDYFPQDAEPKSQSGYRLTPREVEIIDKIAHGHSNKEVGQACSICEKTVKHHLTSIFTKVGVSSRLELALFALNHKLESPAPRKVMLGDGVDLDVTRPSRRRTNASNDL